MSVVNITDDDIKKVEQKFGLTFDEESRKFIKCLESKDIQACPGAGKTTSLVAKLDILSNYMPFDDNSGVLVLTHTNVAVDEIKAKLGNNASKVLGYPNHVGTFQSFVNKYLAIPMYIKLFGKRPERIDSEKFYSLFQKQFEKVNSFHFKWLNDRAKEKHIDVLYFIENLKLLDEEKLQYEGKTIISTNSTMFQAILTISKIPKRLKREGYLTYNDCYSLAIKYLNDYPQIIEVFQKRFKYVFVDEAQDTDDRQFKIINKLFSENTIIQKIGDNNQAIFNFSGQKSGGWKIDDNSIEIKNTKRLSTLISKQVEKVAIEPQKLNGNDTIHIQPAIILFDNPKDVLPKFGELIIENKLYHRKKYSFKAVGAVAKKHDTKDTILDYFPEYQKNNTNQDVDTLIEKLEIIKVDNIRPKDYKKIALDIIKNYLKEKSILNNDKVFTKNTILSTLEENSEDEYNNFKLKLFHITEKLASLECVESDMKELLLIFLDFKEQTLDNEVLSEVIKNYQIQLENESKQNIYTYKSDGINFDIAISTIHKVKGETHIATLVLETYKDGYDIFQLLDFLKGNNNKLKLDDKKKLLYVGMSRPTNLLCLAIHKKHIHRKKEKEVTEKDIEILENNGFRIYSI